MELQYMNYENDHTVYLRLIEACNLYCEHCFIPSNPKKIKKDNIENIINKISEFTVSGQNILVQLHGGEPTLYGTENIRYILDEINNKLSDRNINFGIQTNLLNYDKEWTKLYKEYFNNIVGISWDYEIRRLRKNDEASNEEYEKIFWKNVKQLISDGLTPYLVVTANKHFFKKYRNPFRFYEYIYQKGIRYIHLERITQTGEANIHWDKLGLSNKEYSDYMSLFARGYFSWLDNNSESERLNCSPFDGLYESVKSLNRDNLYSYGCWSKSCDKTFHTFDANGYQPGCTALTTHMSEIDTTKVNIVDIRTMRRTDCHVCQFKGVCSSGCLELNYKDESNECSGAKGLFNTISDITNQKEVMQNEKIKCEN